MRCPTTGKLRYSNEESARHWLRIRRTARARFDQERTKHRKVRKQQFTDVYECSACGGWHLTSGPHPVRKAGRYSRKQRDQRRARQQEQR